MKRNQLFYVLFALLMAFPLAGQNTKIYLGKRKNIIWGRKIESKNLGSLYTYYYPIYYKTSFSAYRKAGVFGSELKPFLQKTPETRLWYRKYKTCKVASYVLLGGAMAALTAWTYGMAKYMADTGDQRLQPFFARNRLPMLGVYFAGFYGSIYLNLRGDFHLKKAVRLYNGAH